MISNSISASRPVPLGPGRMLHVSRDGTVYLARGYSIFKSTNEGQLWQPVCAVPLSVPRRIASASRLASRLLRNEIKAMNLLDNGGLIASTREGVYRAGSGESWMVPCRVHDGDQRAEPPITITIGPGGRVVWGEYISKTVHRLPVRVFASENGGQSFEVVHTFEPGTIRHVHNLHYDAPLDCYWVLAGDHDHEPGIGRLSGDFREFAWVVKGAQQFRAVQAFDFGNCLIYGTDTEMEANAVVRFDKATGRVERLQELDGSCIYACRFGGVYALTTSIEISSVNLSREAGLWVSRDGETWTRVVSAEKDRWHAAYFQFGSIVLPRGESDRDTLYFSGQALKNIDGRAFSISCDSIK